MIIIKNGLSGVDSVFWEPVKCENCGNVFARQKIKSYGNLINLDEVVNYILTNSEESIILQGTLEGFKYHQYLRRPDLNQYNWDNEIIEVKNKSELEQIIKRSGAEEVGHYQNVPFELEMQIKPAFREYLQKNPEKIGGDECPHCHNKNLWIIKQMEKGQHRKYACILYGYDLNNPGDKPAIEMKESIELENKQKAASLLNDILSDIDKNVVDHEHTVDKEHIDNLQFLNVLINTETNISFLKKRLAALLQEHIRSTENYNYLSVGIKEIVLKDLNIQKEKLESEMEKTNQALQFMMDDSEIEKKYSIKKPSMPVAPELHYTEAPVEPVYEKPGLFNKAKVLQKNEELKSKYMSELNQYNSEQMQKSEYERNMLVYEQALNNYQITKATIVEREKELWNKENADSQKELLAHKNELISQIDKLTDSIADPQQEMEYVLSASSATSILNLCNDEIAKIKDLLLKALQLRNDLHNTGIIYNKYLDFVAITTMYEYFASGRCNRFEGPDGAYNLYENESRTNQIITKLDGISTQLEDIKQNQYKLYSAVNTVNKNISTLSDKMNIAINELKKANEIGQSIKENTAVIAYNTAANAYYSKLNAELTNSLGYLSALKRV